MLRSSLDRMIFGYRKYRFDPSLTPKFASLALSSGIIAEFFPDGRALVMERDRKRFVALVKGRLEYTESECLGLVGLISKHKKRYGLFLGALFSALIILISSDKVWDVRISGLEESSRDVILEELAESGFTIGSSWSKTDTSVVENNVLSLSNNISWININRRGTVAYVDIIEKKATDTDLQVKPAFSSVIAEYDCVIEEITVKRGYAAVKVGDAVKKGDILISGVIPDELGGGLCTAEGTVIGRIYDTVSVNVDRNQEISVSTGKKTVAKRVKILNFSINILKYCGNSHLGCDIIKDKEDLMLFGKWRLPISVLTEKAVLTETSDAVLTDAELTERALSEMSLALEEKLSDADLLKIRTKGYFGDTGYTMVSEIVYSQDVGRDAPFTAIPE